LFTVYTADKSFEEGKGVTRYIQFIKKLLSAADDNLEICILEELFHNHTLSFRALARRLRVNYKRLNKALRRLVEADLVKVIEVKVSENRVYRFYALKTDIEDLLEDIL